MAYFTEREQELLVAAYAEGYEQGHHDTIESNYSDAKECADDWLANFMFDSLKDEVSYRKIF